MARTIITGRKTQRKKTTGRLKSGTRHNPIMIPLTTPEKCDEAKVNVNTDKPEAKHDGDTENTDAEDTEEEDFTIQLHKPKEYSGAARKHTST